MFIFKDSATTFSGSSSKLEAVVKHIAQKIIDLSSPVCDPQLVILDDVIHLFFFTMLFHSYVYEFNVKENSYTFNSVLFSIFW
jgi:ABC-type uncharacterized transport system fused permease/ATPase subunit